MVVKHRHSRTMVDIESQRLIENGGGFVESCLRHLRFRLYILLCFITIVIPILILIVTFMKLPPTGPSEDRQMQKAIDEEKSRKYQRLNFFPYAMFMICFIM